MIAIRRSIQSAVSIALVSGLVMPLAAVAAPPTMPVLMAQAQRANKKPRIAVLDFDAGSISSNPIASGWTGQGASKGVADLLVNKLVESGSYRVIERSKINALLQEQDLGASGRVDASTAARIGKMLGVETVMVGSITRFNVDEKSSGFSVGGLFGNKKKTSTATVQITARIIDTESGEILASAQGMGQADQKSGGTQVLGIGGSNEVSNNDTLLSTAADQAVTQIVGTLAGSAGRATSNNSSTNPEAVIADISGTQVTLNKGSIAGFSNGMKLSVERVTKQVKDPSTGQVIRNVTSSVGMLKIVEVTRDYAVAEVTSGTGFKVGDTVVSVK